MPNSLSNIHCIKIFNNYFLFINTTVITYTYVIIHAFSLNVYKVVNLERKLLDINVLKITLVCLLFWVYAKLSSAQINIQTSTN